ncbi:hypothetical protein P4H70_12325 [Paenibacillus ehimensis]|uniref:hypothetical protein n=1 Tax=Paenibacillus ehimensis TaxID=79264 RepID=UPI002DBB687D|nr:hypothetical protein [Paenibacillus ehimensis]MEC0209717.1 hypothetical protein [Paenibacillus ehimensis]
MYKFLGGMQRCLEDAMQQLYNRENGITLFDDLLINLWTQSWADTSLGFGGIGGQMISSAPTLVVTDSIYDKAVVYHGWRFAYKTPCTKLFMEHFAQHRLMGASDFKIRGYDKN